MHYGNPNFLGEFLPLADEWRNYYEANKPLLAKVCDERLHGTQYLQTQKKTNNLLKNRF